MLVVDLELDEPATVRISDPQGRAVRSYRIVPGQKIIEADISGLAAGLYACELLVGNLRLATTKLTLQK